MRYSKFLFDTLSPNGLFYVNGEKTHSNDVDMT